MKLFIKRIILVITILNLFILSGCDKVNFGFFNNSDDDLGSVQVLDDIDEADTEADEDTNISSNNNANDDTSEINKEKVTDTSDITPTPIQPNANKDLLIYTVNSTTAEIEPVTALIPQDSQVTAKLIVDTVVESLADQSIIIEVDSVTTEDDKVIVSFDKDKAPYSDMGSGYEGAILDAIAQSLIDNLKDYNKVIYRIENQPYVSGAFEFGINEAYLGDN